MKRDANNIILTIEFEMPDDSGSFGRFCDALCKNGFRNEVEQMAQALFEEARRRDYPIAKELEAK